MLYFVWFCIFLLVFANVKSIIRLKKSSSFLNKKHDLSTNVNKKIIVIIPAMNEVNNVDKSINYFKSLNDVCNVIYVTTSKEKSMATINSFLILVFTGVFILVIPPYGYIIILSTFRLFILAIFMYKVNIYDKIDHMECDYNEWK